jgi:hypothetical protein
MSSATSTIGLCVVPTHRNREHSKISAVAISAFGVPVCIRVDNPAVIPDLLERVPPGSVPTSEAPPKRTYTFRAHSRADHLTLARKNYEHAGRNDVQYEVRVGRRVLARTSSLVKALDAFESDLQIQVAEMCHDKIFVHAGVVAWKGKAILFPGISGSGKTTLVASLLERGATYYSDEYAVLDDAGCVHPYARPLNVKLRQAQGRIRRHAEYFNGVSGTEPVPIGLIVVSHYQAEGHWEPQELSAGRAVLALINNTVSIRRQPEAALSILCRAVSGVRAVESLRGEASKVAHLLLTELDYHKPGARKSVGRNGAMKGNVNVTNRAY